MPTARKVKVAKIEPVSGGDMWEDIANAAEYAKGAGLKKTTPAKGGDFMDFFPVLKAMGAGLKKTTRGRKKKDLIAHEVLLKELAKVKEPVKTQRRANKKQTALRIEDFVSKVKAKDQVTQLLDGIRIKRALDAQYKKLSDKANERLKQDIINKTSKSKDTEISERIKAEDLKVITDKLDADKLRRERITTAQNERRQLLLEDARDQRRELTQDARQRDIERRQNLLEDARDIRRENVDNLRQQAIEAREDVRYQDRQMLLDTRPPRIGTGRPVGRPVGSYSILPTLTADDDSYSDTTYRSVSGDSVVAAAKELGLSTKGGKEAIARRIVNKKPESEAAVDLFEGLEGLANREFSPKVMITPDLLGGAKLKVAVVEDEGVLPKEASAPAKPRPAGAPPMNLLASLKSGKKLKKSINSGVLDTSAADAAEAAVKAEAAKALAEIASRVKASRANKSYKLETVESMLAELTHRKIDIPERTKLVYVNGNPTYPDIPLSDYKQTLFDLMKNSYKK